jgi:hypothetical protein
MIAIASEKIAPGMNEIVKKEGTQDSRISYK